MPKSQMRSVMRRSDLAHERQKTNLAEPLVSKSWLRCTDKNFADFAKTGVFQHNAPFPVERRQTTCFARADVRKY